ncbi:MAG: CRISPR-associated endonuclease Cas2 [Saprospiraceae bacterium]|nr:CRISPR-associated endonuclease Cas2 [Saprospiraceae bacterium]
MIIRMIIYDIESDPLRTKFSKKLEALGFIRMQYSVFCGSHPDHQWKYCKEQIDKVLSKKMGDHDKVDILRLGKIQLKKMDSLGLAADFEYILSPPDVLWI